MGRQMEAALYYKNKLGFSVIPTKRDKRPYVQWQEFQQRKASDEEVKRWWKQWPDANPAIVTGPVSGVDVIDIDSVEADKSLQEFLPDSLQIPTVHTPSGGKHYYFRHSSGWTNKVQVLHKCDIRTTGGYVLAPPSTNGNGKTYAWADGLNIAKIKIPQKPEFLDSTIAAQCEHASTNLYNRSSSSSRVPIGVDSNGDAHNRQHCPQTSTKMFENGRRDNDLFHTANCLVKGGMAPENIYQVLEKIADTWGEGSDRKWLISKIESAMKRAEVKNRNIAHEVREWVLSTSGLFVSKDCLHDLQLSTRKDRKNASQAFSRLLNEDPPLIERAGNKNGVFRRIEREVEKLDIYSVDPGNEIDMWLPLDLHKYSKILPSNLIVFAGSPNSGKTCMMMNIAIMNLNQGMPVKYITSEMDALEFRTRAELFHDVPLEDWRGLDIEVSASNFHDRIEPDGINIIDYLEISTNFFEIAGMMKSIFDKLRKGVAIIAVQKDQHSERGRGGSFGEEKPRLYVTLTGNPPNGNIAKVRKLKNIRGKDNINGKQLTYNIIDGSTIYAPAPWAYAEKGSE